MLALTKLYHDVRSRFAEEATGAADDEYVISPALNKAVQFAFGFRENEKSPEDGACARVVFMPGAPQGDIGELGPAMYPGQNPRSIATLNELFTVNAWVDCSGDDLEQYTATRLLFDATYRAMYLAAHGNISVNSARYLRSEDRKLKRRGVEIEAICTILAKVPDLPLASLSGVVANVAVTELDQTENIVT